MSYATLILSSIIFIISLFLCYLPSKITSTKLLKKFYPYVTIAAAGFMLAMLLMDFVPHINHSCKNHNHDKDDHKLENCPNRYECEIHKNIVEDSSRIKDSENEDENKIKKNDKKTCKKNGKCDKDFPFFIQNFGFFIAGLSFILLLGIDSIFLQHSHCDNEQVIQMNDGMNHGPHTHDFCHMHNQVENSEILESKNLQHEHLNHNHLEGSCNTSALKNKKDKLQAFIFIIALSIHSLFEGFAIKSDKIRMFELGIIIHKSLESFALGFTINLAEFTKNIKILLITIYSILTPLGMYISLILSNLHANASKLSKHLLSSIFNGLALGSILFIVCVEMIPPNFHTKGANFSKICTLTMGYLVTAGIIYFAH